MIRIVHIEEDPNIRRQVRDALAEGEEFTLFQAKDGISGIKAALEAKPHLILTDINLSDMDGYEVTLKLRGELQGKDIPIVALTNEEDREMSLAVGCDLCLIKPIDMAGLPETLKSVVEDKREKRIEDYGNPALLAKQGQKLAARLQAKIEELELSNRRLVESEKVRADFYRNLSHELSTPLTPAIGYITMLLREELGPLNEVQRRSLRSIERSFQSVRAVIENLLDMTALATGKMSFFARHYEFNQLARDAITMCRQRFEMKGITLEVDLCEGELPAFGDSDKLKRAMVQLLENATKFCAGGGTTHVATRKDKEDLAFLVYDSGEGIPQEEIQAIFRTFYQIDGSPTREHGGAGIGLALARKIMERFGGEIWAESPPLVESPELSWAKTLVAIRVPEVMQEAPKGEDAIEFTPIDISGTKL
jgi:signal transduction histidine kinase